MSRDRKKLIVIVGPTASGKSRLAIQMAKKFKSFIISADSRQIYKGMDIGTSKPSKRELKEVPHYMIDVVKPNQSFTVAQYKKMVLKILRNSKLITQNSLPILVGGTGFFIQAIADNAEFPAVPPNWKLRKRLEKYSVSKLYAILRKLDPMRAKTIDRNNPRRLIRAIEIAKTLKRVPPLKRGKLLFDVLMIGIRVPKKQLQKNIDRRVDAMVKKGLLTEVKKLAQKYSFSLPAMSGIGYKEIGFYLQGKLSLPAAIELIKRNTRNYAKRQMTWFSAHGGSASGGIKDKRINWVSNRTQAIHLAKKFL